MRARLIAFAIATLLVNAAAAEVPERTSLLIAGATVMDLASGTAVPGTDVLVSGDRIAWVGPAGGAPETAAKVFEAAGACLIPGLWDFHVHIMTAPGEEDFALPLYLAHGITSIRDVGAFRSLEEQRALADAVQAGARPGPRIELAGAVIDGPPGVWPGVTIAATAEDGRTAVEAMAEAGWTSIKTYSLVRPEAYAGIAEAARARGLPLFGHVPEAVALLDAARQGHRSIEHFSRITKACSTDEAEMIARNAAALEAAEPVPALLAEMRSHSALVLETWDEATCRAVVAELARLGVFVMPSLVVADFYLGRDPASDDPRMQTVPRAVRERWAAGDFRRDSQTPEEREVLGDSFALEMRTFRMAHDAGVAVLAGSDAAWINPYLFHGASLIDELRRYVRDAGLTPVEALRTATVNPGRYLGRIDLDGRIAPGRRADLVLLGADPLADIDALGQIVAVVADGRLYDRAALDGLLSEARSRAEE